MYKVVLVLALSLVSSCVEKAANKEEAEKRIATEKYEEIKKLPKAVYFDTDLELDMIKAANDYQKKYTVSEVIITSSRWSSTFNESGSIVARTRNATIVVSEGNLCLLQDLVFEQKREGETFLESSIIENKSWHSFKCELLNTKNPDVLVGAQLRNQ